MHPVLFLCIVKYTPTTIKGLRHTRATVTCHGFHEVSDNMETGLEYNGHVVGIEYPVFVYVTS